MTTPIADKTITNKRELREVLAGIAFREGRCAWGWMFKLAPVFGVSDDPNVAEEARHGVRLWVEFLRPDTDTGAMGWGRSRDELVWFPSSETSVVKTAWLLCKLIVEHELMEAFEYQGARLFDPHATVGALRLAARDGGPRDMACSFMDAPGVHGIEREVQELRAAEASEWPGLDRSGEFRDVT